MPASYQSICMSVDNSDLLDSKRSWRAVQCSFLARLKSSIILVCVPVLLRFGANSLLSTFKKIWLDFWRVVRWWRVRRLFAVPYGLSIYWMLQYSLLLIGCKRCSYLQAVDWWWLLLVRWVNIFGQIVVNVATCRLPVVCQFHTFAVLLEGLMVTIFNSWISVAHD